MNIICSLRGRDDCNWRFADTPLRCNTDRANRRNLLCREWSTVYTTSCPCLLSEKLTRWRMPPTQTTTIQSLINIAMCLFALSRWGWRLDRSPWSLLSLYFFALGFFAAFFLPFSVQQHTTPSYSNHIHYSIICTRTFSGVTTHRQLGPKWPELCIKTVSP